MKESYKFLPDAFQFLKPVDAVEFQMRETCYNFRVNRAKYNINIYNHWKRKHGCIVNKICIQHDGDIFSDHYIYAGL